MNRLPTEVLRLIYQFDSTYHDYLQKDVFDELNDYLYGRKEKYDRSCSVYNYFQNLAITPRFYDRYFGQICGFYFKGNKIKSNIPF